MARQEEINTILEIIRQADDRYGDEQTWFYHQKLSEMLVDNGIGTKDRFEINVGKSLSKKKRLIWQLGIEIQPTEYKD